MKLINKYIILLLLGMAALSSCSYLDIVPDTKATFDDCFKSQAECKKFQMYLYQSMPSPGSWYSVPETYAGDDFISGRKGSVKYFQYKSLLYGLESPSQSYFGFWYTGTSEGMDNSRRTILEMYESIRHCYMFLANIDRVPDITEENLRTWKGEAYFLIGFYHQMIFNYYGPCVLIE
ncbi:MAG: RagB/SusD family nutrient uptake outer membrane protein, partial [Bacteroidales bacterium]|nr:RagB/SusD family nutrient uptake outer membrane protein [Bacteroidales bacterium]